MSKEPARVFRMYRKIIRRYRRQWQRQTIRSGYWEAGSYGAACEELSIQMARLKLAILDALP